MHAEKSGRTTSLAVISVVLIAALVLGGSLFAGIVALLR
jgi:hypothetical protein